MRVIARRALQEHWERPGRGDSKEPLQAWFAEARQAKWATPADVKAQYGSASFVADNRVVFNIAGNKYRLVVHLHYERQICRVKFVGTHAEYDEIDAATVGGGAE